MKKYRTLKDLPLAKSGTEVHIIDVFPSLRKIIRTISTEENIGEIKLENISEWLEEIKEPKTIYDLKEWDEYFYINYDLSICKDKNSSIDWKEDAHMYCFLTEREAKRELEFRKLRNRLDKWLPEKWEIYYTPDQWNIDHIDYYDWKNDDFDIYTYNSWLVFRSEKECRKYLTPEVIDLLFKI